jgi:hypothetical protein
VGGFDGNERIGLPRCSVGTRFSSISSAAQMNALVYTSSNQNSSYYYQGARKQSQLMRIDSKPTG